jgi:hypothetical protein
MPNTPNINITNGQVTGTLALGQPFYWYNPNANDVAIDIENCGTWCADNSYTIAAGEQYALAQILQNPNTNPLAWVEIPDLWTAGGGGPHVVSESGAPGTPSLNVETGVVTGTLQAGQPFNWYNPAGEQTVISSCGTWCAASDYYANPGNTAAAVLAVPNRSAYAFTESPNRWDAPGMPHIGTPPFPGARDLNEKHKEVA